MSVLSEMPDKPASPTPTLLTTGQAAKLCVVDPRTIARWADAGLLLSHRTAGGRRRIRSSDLVDFMDEHGMSVLAHDPPRQTRIAVVDDEPAVVRALLHMLARVAPGADCRSAHDGFSAGALLSSFRPDLVFLDIVMPGMSGIEVCKHVRSTPPLRGTAIVVVSGHLTDDLRSRMVAAGADRFIDKPFTRLEIQSAVAELAQGHPQRRLGAA